MLMEENEPDANVNFIPVWCSSFRKYLTLFLEFGFTIEDDGCDIILKKSPSDDWKIIKKIGTPFAYQMRNDSPKFNPYFIIMYKTQIVMTLKVHVYRSSTHYDREFDERSLQSVRDSKNLWSIFYNRLPIDVLTEIEKFIIN